MANAKITLYSDNSGKVHITDQEMTGSEAPQGHPLLGNPQGLPNLRRHQPAPPPPSTPRGTEPPSASPSPKNRRRQIASHLKNTVNFINTSAEPTGPSTPFAKPVAKSVTKPLTRVARARHKAIELLENSIRISQNEQGVLVITNLPEKDSERPIMAAFGKKRHNASFAPGQSGLLRGFTTYMGRLSRQPTIPIRDVLFDGHGGRSPPPISGQEWCFTHLQCGSRQEIQFAGGSAAPPGWRQGLPCP